MKALVWEAPRMMAFREYPKPSIEPDEVLLKVAYSGICGSELSGYLGRNALRVPPLIMGHEFSGGIVALGVKATQKNSQLKEGQKVTVNPLECCDQCQFCQRGLNHLCVSRQLLGAHRPGSNAEFVAVPAGSVVPLPEGMPLRIGALTEPIAVGVRIGELAGSLVGEAALVIGAGPIGLLALQTLQAQKAENVFIADLDPARLDMGEALGGIPFDPNSVDVVQAILEATRNSGVRVSVDAVGTAVTRAQCISSTQTTGTVILSGLHEEGSVMPAADIIRRELVVRGSFAYTRDNFTTALKYLEQGLISLDPWVREVPLAEGGLWFDRLIDAPGDVVKVLFVP